MYRREVMLTLLAMGPDHGYSNFEMQKGMFILSVRVPEIFDTPYVFSKHRLGPFCSDVYKDARALEAADQVVIADRFAIRTRGRCYAGYLLKRLTPRQRRTIGAAARYVAAKSSLALLASTNRLFQQNVVYLKTNPPLMGHYSPQLV